ncbi:glucose-6-phosphate dehydrogenase [Kineococcus sp. NUM-3379]
MFVMYGSTGDLARRLVLPAFFELARRGLLPQRWRLVGTSRGDRDDAWFRDHVRGALEEFGPQPADGPWDDFAGRLSYAGGGFSAEDAGLLPQRIAEAREELGGDVQLVHYLAVPPGAFLGLTRAIDTHGLAEGCRIVYEKPYGTDLDTFEELDAEVQRVFADEQVFRIDHFLAFETVRNMMAARLGNPLVGAIWSAEHVEEVQIDIAETLDVAQRADFYDATGAFLDMIVTHLFQLAATVAMEVPRDLSPGELRGARDAAIAHFREIDPAEVVLGQFEGYRDIEGVAEGSTTDTLAAVRLWVDSERWRGVPFLLRSGKRMAADEQRITLVLRRPEGPLLELLPQEPSALSFSLLEGGRIEMRIVLKKQGVGREFTTGTAAIALDELPGAEAPPYAKLIHDVLAGDQSFFTGVAGLRDAWRAIERFQRDRPEVLPYAPGTWGPDAVEALAEPRQWFLR